MSLPFVQFAGLRAVAALVAVLTVLSGCAIGMKVPIADPTLSSLRYEQREPMTPTVLFFTNETAAGDGPILSGRLSMHMTYQEQPFVAVPWLASHVVAEMVARGLPVTLASSAAGTTNVVVKRMHIENHRVSGFSPFVTFTSLRADLITPRGPQRIAVYIKRGKVPVWSFDEVIDPTFNDALAMLTKEVAAKLNLQLFDRAVSDAEVNALIEKIRRDGGVRDDAFLDVYQLGFSNNRLAVPELVKLSTSVNEYVRLAAVSSLGILKAGDQFDFLVQRYETQGRIWQDRAMALKAIGDLDTAQSRAYLQKALSVYAERTDTEALWTREVIDLYLQ